MVNLQVLEPAKLNTSLLKLTIDRSIEKKLVWVDGLRELKPRSLNTVVSSETMLTTATARNTEC